MISGLRFKDCVYRWHPAHCVTGYDLNVAHIKLQIDFSLSALNWALLLRRGCGWVSIALFLLAFTLLSSCFFTQHFLGIFHFFFSFQYKIPLSRSQTLHQRPQLGLSVLPDEDASLFFPCRERCLRRWSVCVPELQAPFLAFSAIFQTQPVDVWCVGSLSTT